MAQYFAVSSAAVSLQLAKSFGVSAENRLELPKCIGVAVLETV